MSEAVSVHAVLVLGVSDDGLNGGAAPEVSLDGPGQAALHAGDIDLELLVLGGVVAAIAGIGDDLAEALPQSSFQCRR